MSRRAFFFRIASVLVVLAISVGAHPTAAGAQDVSEPSNAAERALVAKYPDEWSKLTPEQRQQVLANYRQWQQMPPVERHLAEQNYQQFRALPPEERQQVLAGLRQWRKLPEARRNQLREAYAHYKLLPPHQREQIMQHYQRFQSLPPDQQRRVLNNYNKWQRLTPQQRENLRRRWGQPKRRRNQRYPASRSRREGCPFSLDPSSRRQVTPISRRNVSSLSQSLAKEFEHSRPMALGRGWVEDGHIRNREAMACAGISLDQMVHPCLGQSLFEAVLLFLGETPVLDSTGDIDTAGNIIHEKMRAVRLVRGQIAAMKRRDRRKSTWERAGRGQGSIAAHAIACAPESITFDVGSG